MLRSSHILIHQTAAINIISWLTNKINNKKASYNILRSNGQYGWNHLIPSSLILKFVHLVVLCYNQLKTNWNINSALFINLPSFSICIFAPLYFQRTVGGGELTTSQTMLALSPSVNSWGEGAFWKVIFSGIKKKTSTFFTQWHNEVH